MLPELVSVLCLVSVITHVISGVLHLMPSSSRVYFVETDQRRYVPKEGDMNIGIIVERHIENYTVDIGAAALASLPTVAFDGATRRNKPNLTSGDTVFCRVSVANKDMDVSTFNSV